MSKIFTFLFILLALVYIYFLQQFRNAGSSNYVNEQLRPLFLQIAMTRWIFFLNDIGDARFDYVSSDKPTILVEVDYQQGKNPDGSLEEWMDKLVGETVRKKVEVEVSEERKIADAQEFSDRELRELSKVTKDYDSSENRSYLHVLYVSKSSDFPSNTGLALSANELFIFRDGIDGLSDRESMRARIEESTIKHEFGHLLGLEHVEWDDCVMSEKVEVYEKRKYQFENIPLDYCKESLDRLREMRRSVL